MTIARIIFMWSLWQRCIARSSAVSRRTALASRYRV